MLEPSQQRTLLGMARRSIEGAVLGSWSPQPDLEGLDATLLKPGACFITLTIGGQLRGCIGSIEARQPLAMDVWEHAADAAQNDFRFPPVVMEEVRLLEIEISVLTQPVPVKIDSPEELLRVLRPGEDGVILIVGNRRATFLPQVWEKIPDPVEFLDALCEKMGQPAGAWRRGGSRALTYQVQSFAESPLKGEVQEGSAASA
ncbi:MAG: AmmeMemoRadiSam system protein A [Anaerolineales bacterium]|jgi:AmmeMemoRadiSam system protein A